MNDQPKKVLIISLGSIGKRHLRNVRTLLPDAQIAVLRRGAQQDLPPGADLLFTDFKEAVSFEPNAVIIASPAHLHIDDALPFLEKEIPLFLEKPISHSTQNLDAFVEFCQKSNTFVMVGYILRFLPALLAVKKVIQAGKLGKIYTGHIQVGQYLPDWRPTSDYRSGVSAQSALGGGALLELSHEIDYAIWLFGHPDHIYCRSGRSSDLEIDVEDNANILFEYDHSEGHKTVIIQLDFLQRVPQLTLQIVGSAATLKADLIRENVTLYYPNDEEGQPLEFTRSQNGNEPYLKQFDFFFAKSFSDYKPQYETTLTQQSYSDVDQAAAVIRLIEKAKASNVKGCRV